MRIFNKFLKKKVEFEVDLYTLKDGDSSPFMLDAKLSVHKNEINISNSSKKCTFYEENIYDFKYHEVDMCQFKYLCKNVVEEYGMVFSDVSGMYNFYKYIMYTYIKGNIILCRNVNLFKYENSRKILYKKNYYGVLIFNTDKCEHLLIVVKSNREEKKKALQTVEDPKTGTTVAVEKITDTERVNKLETEDTEKISEEDTVISLAGERKNHTPFEKREDLSADEKLKDKKKKEDSEHDEEKEAEKEEERKNAECEIYYKEVTIENLRQLYKRNKIFIVYVLSTYNDVYLSNESLGIYTRKYAYKNCYKYIEYKGLYSDAENFMRFFVPRKWKCGGKKGKEKQVSKESKKEIVPVKKEKDSTVDSSANGHENETQVMQKEIKEEQTADSKDIVMSNTSEASSKEKQKVENETKGTNGTTDDKVPYNEGEDAVLKWNEKVLITFDSESILLDYIQKILIYRYDFKNDILNIKEDYLNTQTSIGFNNKSVDARDIEDEKSDTKEEKHADDNDENGSEYLESDSEEEVDTVTRDQSDMKFKHVNVAGKYSFVLRQNYLIPKRNRRKFSRSHIGGGNNNADTYSKIKNDLNIYLFDEYGKEKRTYNSDNKLFRYNDETCVPKDFQVNDDAGNKLIFLDERKDTNMYMVDVNTEKVVQKWDTEYVPIEKLLKKRENLYCGYNENSIYYVDTRMKDCVQSMVQYKTGAPIEHAAIDEEGHILLMNADGELKYYDGQLNYNNVIKRCKNVLYCAKDAVHITTTKDGEYSIITCEQSIIICDNFIDNKWLFENVVKVENRYKQKKICLQVHYADVISNHLEDYKFIRSDISDDQSFIFTFAQNFYVIWNFKDAINGKVSYVIKKTDKNISDLSLFNVNDVQGVVLATEDKLTAKKITERTIKQFKAPKA